MSIYCISVIYQFVSHLQCFGMWILKIPGVVVLCDRPNWKREVQLLLLDRRHLTYVWPPGLTNDTWGLKRNRCNKYVKYTSHMARCVTFAVARIRVKGLPLEIGKIMHIFPSGTESMGDRGSIKTYTGPRTGNNNLPTKFGCDRSIVVGCRSRNDRQTDKQMEWQ